MASTTTTSFVLQGSQPVAAHLAPARSPRRRRITPQAGRALEILGHAIEYLADEYVHSGSLTDTHQGQIQAMQLLMSLNRSIYFDCPEVPTFRERCSAMLSKAGFRV